MPKNHEKAQALLKEKAQKEALANSSKEPTSSEAFHHLVPGRNRGIETNDDEDENSSDNSTIGSNVVEKTNPQTPMQLDSVNSHDSDQPIEACTSMQRGTSGCQQSDPANNASKAGHIQSTLSAFVTTDNSPVTSTMEQIQSGINQILVKMERFTLNERHGVEASMPDMLNCGTTELRAVNNLKELSHPDKD